MYFEYDVTPGAITVIMPWPYETRKVSIKSLRVGASTIIAMFFISNMSYRVLL